MTTQSNCAIFFTESSIFNTGGYIRHIHDISQLCLPSVSLMLIFMPKQSKTKTLKVNFIQWPTYRQKLTTEFLENISCSLFCSVSRNKTTKRDIFSLNFCRSNAFKSAVAICVFFSWVSFSSLTTLEQNYPKRNIDLLKAGGTCGKKRKDIYDPK